MRIALLTDGISPYVIGGMQTHSFYLARYLLLNEVHLTLVHCLPFDRPAPVEGETLKKLLPGDVFVDPSRFTEICLHFPRPGRLPGHYIRNSYRYSVAVANSIRGQLGEFDFIFAQGFSGWKLITEKKKGAKHPPIGVHFHGLNMFQHSFTFRGKLNNLMFRPAVLYNLRNCDVILTFGGKIKDILVSQGLGRKKMIVQSNGIDRGWLADPATIKTNVPREFLFIGRYERLKGVEELNRALETLVDRDFHFTIIGNIPEHVRIAHPNVTYTGIVEYGKIKECYTRADILVLPSWSEGMPTVILEAMARGMAVIATDTGAVNEMVNEENGWLVQPGNANALAKAMNDAIEISTGQLEVMKRNAIAKAERSYAWDSIIQKLLADIQDFQQHSKGR